MDVDAPGGRGVFSGILDKLNEGLLVVDGDLRIVYANDAALALAGCAREQALGRPLQSAFPLINSEDLSPLLPAGGGAGTACFANTLLRSQSAGHRVIDCYAAPAGDGAGGGYALLLRDTADAKRLSALLRFRDLCDPLTGLNKSAVFLGLLQRTLDEPPPADGARALLYLDIDFFQAALNTGGSAAVGAFLVQAADLLRKNTGAADTLAHVKQDDFAVLTGCCSRERAGAAAKRILEAFRKHKFAYNGRNWALTVSVGARILRGADSYAETALAAARAACREAYRRGGNRLVFASAAARNAR